FFLWSRFGRLLRCPFFLRAGREGPGRGGEAGLREAVKAANGRVIRLHGWLGMARRFRRREAALAEFAC
ncbi:hypothetical protein, partial [Methyloversatilis sp.]|uniref:hypothetical protein n=1 Tax=Methyloversatilis sp. TaxID=2569862 RepID=UPI0027BAA6D1